MGILDGDLGFNLGKYMPNFTGLGSSFINVALLFIVVSALIVVGYMLWSNTRYKYKIEIFENLGGTRYVKTGVDRARVQKLGNQGEEILILKKRKKIVTSYNRKMGQNLLWFAIGQDGTWVNITLGDLDAKQGMLDIEPVDRDMRYAHVSLRKAIEEEFSKTKFMDKYGSLLMQGVFLIIIIIGIGYLLTRIGTIGASIVEGIRVSTELAKTNQQILAAMDNICSNSGIIR